ncbi:MAG: DNA double-strand break repair nuclease NurA [Thermomicrobiales bacterium]
MTLDLALIAGQIAEMVDEMESDDLHHRFNVLRDTWQRHDGPELADRLTNGRSTFMLPAPQEDYSSKRSLPEGFDSYAIAATDGSFILPSRHNPARYYLLNTGRVLLEYGEPPRAMLDSKPELRFREEDLAIGSPVHNIPVNGSTIGPKRAAEELREAADLLGGARSPAVALQDGTLILWSLETLPEPVAAWTLPPFLEAMRWFRDNRVPVASYVSAPGSREIVNLMRIAICDYPPSGVPVNCDHCRNRILTENHTPACDVIPHVTDRYFFEEIEELDVGERSAVFSSTSQILDRYGSVEDDSLRIDYFYLNAGNEIGRVEIPRWVSRSDDLLDIVHWIVFDQCERGRGYPVALQEAHEQAVLSTSDRLMMEIAIERELARHNIVLTHTGKDGSKRGRFV